jgi:protein-S-isoprenylcysteine O-methyltransferase Ste14
MSADLLTTTAIIWALFGVYWVLCAVRNRKSFTPPAESESSFYRPFRILLLAFAFLLLFWKRTAIGVLGSRFVPQTSAIAIAGFVIMLAGLGIGLWARRHLGEYWSDKVMLQASHKLIRSGPYAYMRHPIYSGVLLGMAGTALILGEWRGVLSFLLMSINYTIKAKREEHILRTQFGAEFEEHKNHAGFLLPRL